MEKLKLQIDRPARTSLLKYSLKHLFLLLVGFFMATACTAQTADNQTAQTTTAPETPVLAQASPKPTTPEDIPILELKPATQRQKDILSRMPEGGYSRIPRELIRVAEVDLNNDGSPEFIATYNPPTPGYCGNRGCEVGIYSTIQGRWRIIYLILGWSPTGISNTSTNGFRDLLVRFSSMPGIEVQRVLTFNNGEYSHTHFQDGNDRFRVFPQERSVNFPRSTVFFTRPSKDSPRTEPPLLDTQGIIVARTSNNYYLVTCSVFACAGRYTYVPVEVVDGR